MTQSGVPSNLANSSAGQTAPTHSGSGNVPAIPDRQLKVALISFYES